MSWLIKKTPKTSIAGMNLTREKAQNLVDIWQWLEDDLHKQITDIDAFPSITGTGSFHALSQIQQRHSQITKRIEDLNLCIPTSADSWPKELYDAKASMARKVKVCNDKSRPFSLGWKQAAKQFWPLIAETYTLILELIGRLKQELRTALEDEKTWTETKANKLLRRASVQSILSPPSTSNTDMKHVVFDKKVTVRYCNIGEALNEDDEGHVAYGAARKIDEFTTNLKNDKKNTAGKYKRRALFDRATRPGSADTADEVVQEEVSENTPQDSVA
ncbi:hypothetical protein A1F97_04029 [Pyrenophora tritici-repentis]|uniref:Uncharacterized protein n=3 Tax=Pyrenophora tritici-repentis TaxID=45151 RepID=A0A2W1G354_9PLEO|nr:uncharacterized protein PTRG_08017 [Pyrenophora tritici-repentis Pt-1C-BFP]KAI1515735.1 hypothetical protein Ptr86124_005736 [Pyrenophora tritici-repentis]EDU50936.1 predicted protein [Pyrenophora tritici-repentis Pt-1C-BFP]KAI1664615.1 hypothetical protein L13192_11799 [Pyrenophora tritici-repentis]KAI1678724.1 hypothetical protein KJE20_12332 [Pyrenophora tritici-repentis]PZC97979.1 hypothetical protein A1F95_04443 [Pyrenophora tritici-repentis]